jgi:hypothetical protein
LAAAARRRKTKADDFSDADALMKYEQVALVCDHCYSTVCLPVCCHFLNQGVYDEGNAFSCRERRPASLRPPRFFPTFADKEGVNYTLIYRDVERCSVNSANRDGLVLAARHQNFQLMSNGSLSLNGQGPLYTPGEYCLAFEAVSDDGGRLLGAHARLCPREESSPQVFIVTTAYPICCNVSNLFLLLTFLTYALLPELRRPLFGRLLMAFVAALFFAYLFISLIAIGHLRLIVAKDEDEEYSVICRVLGFATLFFFLSTFSWMNVLSYDIFRKFTRIRAKRIAATGDADDMGDRRRLLRYTAYATLLPAAITLLTLVVEYLPESYDGVRPGFGVRTCFFDTRLANFLFFHVYLLCMQVKHKLDTHWNLLQKNWRTQ